MRRRPPPRHRSVAMPLPEGGKAEPHGAHLQYCASLAGGQQRARAKAYARRASCRAAVQRVGGEKQL